MENNNYKANPDSMRTVSSEFYAKGLIVDRLILPFFLLAVLIVVDVIISPFLLIIPVVGAIIVGVFTIVNVILGISDIVLFFAYFAENISVTSRGVEGKGGFSSFNLRFEAIESMTYDNKRIVIMLKPSANGGKKKGYVVSNIKNHTEIIEAFHKRAAMQANTSDSE